MAFAALPLRARVVACTAACRPTRPLTVAVSITVTAVTLTAVTLTVATLTVVTVTVATLTVATLTVAVVVPGRSSAWR